MMKAMGTAANPAQYLIAQRYLADFDRLQKSVSAEQELYDAMTELYPNWVSHQSWLMFGF